MSRRIEILKNSLEKKEVELSLKLENHFSDVRSANGQPLNDKRNGRSTMNRWERQSNSIRSQIESIEKTKSALNRQESKDFDVLRSYESMPECLKNRIDQGLLKQWGKHPRIMFVSGVEKARIYFDEKTGICSHKFVKDIPSKEQYYIFRDVFNSINREIAAGKGK